MLTEGTFNCFILYGCYLSHKRRFKHVCSWLRSTCGLTVPLLSMLLVGTFKTGIEYPRRCWSTLGAVPNTVHLL